MAKKAKAKKAASKPHGFIRYTTYNFVDKDPIIDVLRTEKQRLVVSDQRLSNDTKVSISTLRNWFVGKTKRPQFATVAAVGAALGMQVLPIKNNR